MLDGLGGRSCDHARVRHGQTHVHHLAKQTKASTRPARTATPVHHDHARVHPNYTLASPLRPRTHAPANSRPRLRHRCTLTPPATPTRACTTPPQPQPATRPSRTGTYTRAYADGI